jgi:hypothetical protein
MDFYSNSSFLSVANGTNIDIPEVLLYTIVTPNKYFIRTYFALGVLFEDY